MGVDKREPEDVPADRRYRVRLPDSGYYRGLVSCQVKCPVHTDARAYVNAIAARDYERAYLIAREPNPFASVCAWVCNAPCEAACRRGMLDEAVAIRALKRFVAERHGVKATGPAVPRAEGDLGDSRTITGLRSLRNLPPELKARGAPPVAVVGSGPSGLACAHDLALLGYRVTVFEASDTPGGMLTAGIPEYRLPREIVRAEIQAILDLGVELQLNTPLGSHRTLGDLRRQGYQACFVAVGAGRARELRIPGAELDGILKAVDFLLNVNRGYRVDLGGRVLVIGGGNVAMDAARTAARVRLAGEVPGGAPSPSTSWPAEVEERDVGLHTALDVSRTARRLGAREVQVICLESWAEMPAAREEIDQARTEGVVMHPGFGPKQFLGLDRRVTGVEALRVASVFDPDGRFNPKFTPETETLFWADTVIVAIGQAPDLPFLSPEDGVQLDRRGLIMVNPETLATTAPGVFAGGDVAFGPRIVIDAVADGKRAAWSIHQYLQGFMAPVRMQAGLRAVPPTGRQRPAYLVTPRRPVPCLPVERRIGIAEVELGYSEPEAVAQASRCLQCSIQTVFDPGKCILCAACVDICPQYCLKLVPLAQLQGDETVDREIATRLPSGAWGTAMIKDETACTRCGLCAERCPTGAITMAELSFQESLTLETTQEAA